MGNEFKLSVQTFRLSASEEAEIAAYLQRVGGTKSEFFRNAVLGRVRGSADFTEMLPMVAESLEREMADLGRTLKAQLAGVQALAAAAVASSAMLLDDGKSPPASIARVIEEHIGRAVAFAPGVVGNLAKPAGDARAAAETSR